MQSSWAWKHKNHQMNCSLNEKRNEKICIKLGFRFFVDWNLINSSDYVDFESDMWQWSKIKVLLIAQIIYVILCIYGRNRIRRKWFPKAFDLTSINQKFFTKIQRMYKLQTWTISLEHHALPTLLEIHINTNFIRASMLNTFSAWKKPSRVVNAICVLQARDMIYNFVNLLKPFQASIWNEEA